MNNLLPVENLYEEVNVNTKNTLNNNRPYGRSWKFDFDKGDFIISPIGQMKKLNELDSYIEWCYKTLQTPRYRYVIYSRNYGNELDVLIGKDYTNKAIESEIKRMVTESLMINIYTKSVDNFAYKWDKDSVYYTFEVTTTLGETSILKSKLTVSK